MGLCYTEYDINKLIYQLMAYKNQGYEVILDQEMNVILNNSLHVWSR